MSVHSVLEARLTELDLDLPEPPRPLGAYTPAVQAGNLLFLSGMLPLRDGSPAYQGTIGADLDLASAQDAVRLAVLNGLSAARHHLGSLHPIQQVVRLAVYQRATPDFTDHAKVADVASNLLKRIFGPAAGHTRMIFGVSSLPGSMPIEVELVFEISSSYSIEREVLIQRPPDPPLI